MSQVRGCIHVYVYMYIMIYVYICICAPPLPCLWASSRRCSIVPVLTKPYKTAHIYNLQGAEVGPADAALFQSVVYKSADILSTIQTATLLGGIGAGGLGLVLLLITCLVARPRCVVFVCIYYFIIGCSGGLIPVVVFSLRKHIQI
jgi:hypothetical protein